jgi:hypothetical protein
MKNRQPASAREQPAHRVQLRLHEIRLRLRENLLHHGERFRDLLEQSCPRWQKLRPITISFS